MKIYFATDHAGFTMKEQLVPFVRDDLGHEVEDLGACELDTSDDYPDFVHKVAKTVSETQEEVRAIILGGSGQGEAMVANKYIGVRAAVYYGEPQTEQMDITGQELGMIVSTRVHNDANILSLGARFITLEQAKQVIKIWLTTEFTNEKRHKRRINKIDI